MAASVGVRYVSSEPWTDLLHVSPSQFNIQCTLGNDKFLQLSITNNGNDTIAWKLKTNRPGRYMVSPKQGIIAGHNHQDCTVVLSKLKSVPDTKKPDKFLIQATKVENTTRDIDLPQLWKDRESKHDKKRGVFAYQAITIKCYLDVSTTPFEPPIATINEDHSQRSNAEEESVHSKSSKDKVNIIEDYVSSESTADHDSPSKTSKSAKSVSHDHSVEIPEESTRSTPILEAPSISKANKPIFHSPPHPVNPMKQNRPMTPLETGMINNAEDQRQKVPMKSVMNLGADSASKMAPKMDHPTSPHAKEVEQWKRKALEYDDLFQFTRKTLAQRDELNQRWKHEQEKARKFEKLNREMREEKKRILAEFTKFRNRVDDEDTSIMNAEDEEKREVLGDTLGSCLVGGNKRQKAKEASIREMEEMDQKAIRNSREGLNVSIVHILITVLLMMAAYQYGQWNVPGNIDSVADDVNIADSIDDDALEQTMTDKQDV